MAYKAKPAIERFVSKTTLAPNGCLEWTGGRNEHGYGVFFISKTPRRISVKAHRWLYEHTVGPIPDGLQLGHLCRNRACVNPAHLEPVTPRENILRGQSPAALHAKKTHCPQGHPYEGANLFINSNGDRVCRECKRARDRRRSQDFKGRVT